MKKPLFLLILFFLISQLITAQSVTLATTTVNPTKGTVVYNNGTNQLQYWNGTAWIPITNAASGTGWALSGTHVVTNNTGYVGIGVTGPDAPLVVKAEGIGMSQQSYDGNVKMGFYTESGSGGIATLQTHSNHDLTFATGNGSARMIIQKNTGNVGIGVSTANYKLDVSDRIRLRSGSLSNTAGLWLNNPDNTASIAFMGTAGPTTAGIFGLNSGWGVTLNTSNGYVGIGNNAVNSVNKLQIGSVGATNYNGNDFVIGNGTSALAINQTAFVTEIVPTTDIALLPRGNVSGRVGINTSTPRAALDVVGSAPISSSIGYAYVNFNSFDNGVGRCYYDCIANVSIFASQAVWATEFDAFSDARIKDIIGVSNSAKDLETIKALQITDYTLKDKIKNGYKPYKKVIAQQVEKYYPQAVNKSVEVVPDIYSLAETVVFNEENKTLIVSLSQNYDIKIGEKIEFVHEKEGKIKAEVIEVFGNSFTVKDWKYPADKIFVYGREVNDFRSIDYEAISMLGISAIQQLAKENDALRVKNEKLAAQFKQLQSEFSARLDTIESLLQKPQTGK